MAEQDEAWSPTKRETLQDVERRIGRFWNWIVSERVDRVVVVSHGVWIECLLRKLGALPDGQRVYNTDAYAMKIHSKDGTFLRASEIGRIYSGMSA